MAIEYKLISHEEYQSCKNIAETILNSISAKNHISLNDIRYVDAINYLVSVAGPTDLCLFVGEEFCSSTFQYSKYTAPSLIKTYNLKFRANRIPLYAKKIDVVHETFSKMVSGFTLFPVGGPIMFLSAETNTWERTIFTIVHELVHSYLALTKPDYKKQVALLNDINVTKNPYPEDLQLIEAETNVISSLLYAPSCSFKENIMYNDLYGLCKIYSMSVSAMHNRIHNFLYYENNFSENEAKNALFAFRYDEKDKMHKYRQKLEENNIGELDLPW